MNIVVSTSTRLLVGETGVRIPTGEDIFFFSPKRPNWMWSAPSLLFNEVRCSFRGLKQPRRGTDSTPFTATVKKVRSYSSTPHIRLTTWTGTSSHLGVLCVSGNFQSREARLFGRQA